MVTRFIIATHQSPQFLLMWRALLVVWIAFVLYASLTPVDLEEIEFPFMDKLLHFAIHTANVVLAALAFPAARAFAISLIGLFLLGPAIELLQDLTPDRTASIGDQIANSFGFLFGWLASRYWRNKAAAESEL